MNRIITGSLSVAGIVFVGSWVIFASAAANDKRVITTPPAVDTRTSSAVEPMYTIAPVSPPQPVTLGARTVATPIATTKPIDPALQAQIDRIKVLAAQSEAMRQAMLIKVQEAQQHPPVACNVPSQVNCVGGYWDQPTYAP